MQHIVRYFVLFFSCLFFIAVNAQVNQLYIFLHLGTHDGLASDETQATVQDAKGYIWIAGKNGLQRYDGNRFLNFKYVDGDTNSLPHNNVTQLVLDKNNRLWLTTANNNLGYFDIKQFKFYEVHVLLNGKPVNKPAGILKCDLQKNILFILYDSKLAKNVLTYNNETAKNVLAYDEQKRLFDETDKRFNLPVNWSIHSFSVDSLQHNYWIATNEGLIKFNQQKNTYSYRGHNVDNDSVINALQHFTMVENALKDNDGNFWMNTYNTDRKSPNLIKYNATQQTVYNYSKEINSKSNAAFNSVFSISQPQKGPVFITGRGLFAVGTGSLGFINSNMPGQYSINFYEIRNVMFDRENNCWLSTDNGVFKMIWSTGFKYVDNKKYGSDNIYNSDVVDFLHLPNGNILVASWGSGLFEYDSDLNPVKSNICKQADAMQEKFVWSLLRRSNNDIWSTNQDGYIFIYHASTNTTEKLHPPVFENSTIRQIAEDRNGDIWLGCRRAIVKWQQKTNTFKLIQKTTDDVFRLYADWNRDIWAIAGTAIQFDVDKDTVKKQYTNGMADGKHLLSGNIVDVIQYSSNGFLIATEGLNFVDTQTGNITYFTTTNGLPTNYISNIIADKQNTLWVFTENGVCNINFAKHNISTYNIDDGISNSSFTPTSSILLNDGRIAIGTVKNIMVFNPANVNNYDSLKPAVEIAGISIMNKPVNTDSLLGLNKIALGASQNSMNIQFSTLSYRNNYNIVYKMQGLDEAWQKDNGRNEAVYSYLPPGTYTFKTGIDTVGGIKIFNAFTFKVEAPFYKTLPFYLTIILLAILILWRINRERIKRIKDLLIMRSNIGKELHNEVSNTLKSISVLSEIAAMKANVNPEQSKDYIQEIKLKSRSTVIAMDDVMWSIDPANDSMQKITERMNEIADGVYHEFNTTVNIEINAKAQQYDLSMKERLELMLIYKKALLMLAAHTQSKMIIVMLESKKDDLLLKLSADGKVENRNDLKLQKELDEIKARAAEIQCEIDLQAGDTFTAFAVTIKHR